MFKSSHNVSVVEVIHNLIQDYVSDFINKVPEQHRQNVASILCDRTKNLSQLCDELRSICHGMTKEDEDNIGHFRKYMIDGFRDRFQDIGRLSNKKLTEEDYFSCLYAILHTIANTFNEHDKKVEETKQNTKRLLEEKDREHQERLRKSQQEKDQLEKANRNLSQTNEDLVKRLKNTDSDRQLANARYHVNENPKVIKELERKLQDVNERLENARDQLQALKKECETYRQQLKAHECVQPKHSGDEQEYKNKIDKIQKEMDEAVQEEDFLKAAALKGEKEKLNDTWQKRKRAIEAGQQQWKQKKNDLESTKQHAETRKNEAEQEIAILNKELEKIRKLLGKKKQQQQHAEAFLAKGNKSDQTKEKQEEENAVRSGHQTLLDHLDQCYRRNNTFFRLRRFNVGDHSEKSTAIFTEGMKR
jgi:chromosome segregation ATPase